VRVGLGLLRDDERMAPGASPNGLRVAATDAAARHEALADVTRTRAGATLGWAALALVTGAAAAVTLRQPAIAVVGAVVSALLATRRSRVQRDRAARTQSP
jgi:hypothetical protein